MHESGQEVGAYLQPAMKAALLEYKGVNNGVLPKTVIVYRDGFSKRAVQEMEISALKNAFKEVECAENIQFIVIGVNKRISTKFYSVNSIQSLQGAENTKPGTLVDENVCETADGNDFYLIVQKTTQGSATQTHYHIICNEMGANY